MQERGETGERGQGEEGAIDKIISLAWGLVSFCDDRLDYNDEFNRNKWPEDLIPE